MKKLKLTPLLLLYALSFFSCQIETELIPKQDEMKYIEEICITEDKELMNYLSIFNAPSSIARASSIIDSIDMETAIKRKDTLLAMTHYSMTVRDNNPLALTNFLLSEKGGELTGYLITYDPEFEWIREQYLEPKWNTFNGLMTVQTLDGDTVLSKKMINGREINSTSSSGRLNFIECEEETYLDYYVSVEGHGTTYYFNTITTCMYDKNDPPDDPYNGGGNPANNSEPNTGGSSSAGINDSDTESSGRTNAVNSVIYAEEFMENIDDSQLRPCMQSIMEELKTLTKGVGQIVVKFAGNEPGYNWKTKHGSLANNQNAMTSTKYESGTVTTTFDTNKFGNASELSVVRTMLHEAVHAYLVAWYINTPSFDERRQYPMLMEDYADVNVGVNASQHNAMIRSFVLDIGQALEEYGELNGYNLSSQFYNDLAWGGLTHSVDSNGGAVEMNWFKGLVPNANDRTRINNVINVELTGKDTNGNSKTQKGNNAGC